MTKILLAATQKGMPIIQEMVPKEFEYIGSHCLAEAKAKAALHQDLDLIICGVHFDDGAIFELLSYAKSRPALLKIPFIGVKVLSTRFSGNMYVSVDLASRTLGSDGIVDLANCMQTNGVDGSRKRFRAFLYKTLGLTSPENLPNQPSEACVTGFER